MLRKMKRVNFGLFENNNQEWQELEDMLKKKIANEMSEDEFWQQMDKFKEKDDQLAEKVADLDCKIVWVWKIATCNAVFGFQKNLYCMTSNRTPVCVTRRRHFSCGIGISKPSKNLCC